MEILPQELLDMVIDRLADSIKSDLSFALYEEDRISNYSMVSRQWVERTQKHHFETVHFFTDWDIAKWRTRIEPDPSGVSRHARRFLWDNVDNMGDFDINIRAFTNLEVATFIVCDIFLLPSIVESFAPMGSSLVKLEIEGGSTTPHIITSLLAALPLLREFRAVGVRVQDDHDTTGFPPRIPFFEDPNTFEIMSTADSLDWIPSSARFRNLHIGMPCIIGNPGLVENWIASSAGSLQFLSIAGEHGAFSDFSGPTPFPTTPADHVSPPSSPFPPVGPLGVYRAGVPETLECDLPTWENFFHHPFLPLVVFTFQHHPAGGTMASGDRPSGLGGGGGASLSASQTVQDRAPWEKVECGGFRNSFGSLFGVRVCGAAPVQSPAQVEGGSERSDYGAGGYPSRPLRALRSVLFGLV